MKEVTFLNSNTPLTRTRDVSGLSTQLSGYRRLESVLVC